MGRSMLPILILTTLALSSSDVLPILINEKKNIEPFSIDNQENDNIFINRYQANNIPSDIFFNKRAPRDNDISLSSLKEMTKAMYAGKDNNQNIEENNEVMNKEENYDDKGYRKEQWHNYPRQLDRLQNYQYEINKFDEAPKAENNDAGTINNNINDFTANELSLHRSDGSSNAYDTIVAATNPFLVLKLQLSYLRNDMNRNDLNEYSNLLSLLSEPNNETKEKENKSFLKFLEPVVNVVKVKREKPIRIRDNESSDEDSFASDIGTTSGRKKTVKKRLFSLWSRLQGLSHRGHELHHRRHLHAFYGSPDNNGNRIVTAQTRAIFVRPPGSPLRWG
ncbi:unnamed protein product [Parnassius apollo]|uniref:(apollo) hypothetical protein n=1 Tax=Parnassius apollo TaxID=110799 RepID=A0A8S3XUU3_PARAO|nr:unnamed protein product [Parnassius apollo]